LVFSNVPKSTQGHCGTAFRGRFSPSFEDRGKGERHRHEHHSKDDSFEMEEAFRSTIAEQTHAQYSYTSNDQGFDPMTDEENPTPNDDSDSKQLFLTLYMSAITGIYSRVSVDPSNAANEAFIAAERAFERLHSEGPIKGEGQRQKKTATVTSPTVEAAIVPENPPGVNVIAGGGMFKRPGSQANP
jgi:hypothetical protein